MLVLLLRFTFLLCFTFFRPRARQTTNGIIGLGTWNIEGYTEAKRIAIQCTMYSLGLQILCIQETHRACSDYFISEEGYLWIFAGNAGNSIEHAGVGFVVAPSIRASIYGFAQTSSRLACIKLRVRGGKCAIISTYAPTGKYFLDERQGFFQDLRHYYESISVNGLKLIMGDLNSRLYCRYAGEDHIIGDYYFRNAVSQLNPSLNRFFLIRSVILSLINLYINKFLTMILVAPLQPLLLPILLHNWI